MKTWKNSSCSECVWCTCIAKNNYWCFANKERRGLGPTALIVPAKPCFVVKPWTGGKTDD